MTDALVDDPTRSGGQTFQSLPTVTMQLASSKTLDKTIFQQRWWLECASGGAFGEVSVEDGGQIHGWLPYVVRSRWGFSVSDMPLLTHTLGPVISPGAGRPQTQFLRTVSITGELLSKLPKLAYFRQVLAPDRSEALGFLEHGYHVKTQFTFIAECADMAAAWSNMRDKTRNLLRRSQEKNTVSHCDDAEEFLRHYDLNCGKRSQINRYCDPRTKRLIDLCVQRDQGEIILSRNSRTGAINGGIFVVWDERCMYFLMSTRSPESANSGVVSMLVWSAMNEANRRGLSFDFDGVTSPGSFRFLSGFGGNLARRAVVEKFSSIYHSIDKLRALAYGNAHRPFE